MAVRDQSFRAAMEEKSFITTRNACPKLAAPPVHAGCNAFLLAAAGHHQATQVEQRQRRRLGGIEELRRVERGAAEAPLVKSGGLEPLKPVQP